MKLRRKKRMTSAVLLAIGAGLFILFQWSHLEIHKEIRKNQAPSYDEAAWASMKSEDINRRGIAMLRDDHPVDAEFYMDENLKINIRSKDVKESFLCAVGLYDRRIWRVQKKDTILEFPVDENCYYVNGKRIEDGRYLVHEGREDYLPLDVLAEQFACSYQWDPQNNVIQMKDNWQDSVTPARYSLQENGRDTVIKNQGTLGTCWAVASLSALETSLKPEEDLLFATDHMSIRNSFFISQNDGGEYTMSMAYLLAWQGPVLEADDPYGDKISPEGLSAVKHVQEVQVYKEKDIEKIKQAVFFYGAVQSSIYTSLRSESSRSAYYNKKEAAYCYIGDATPNHEIIIIGWDDNYPKENFNLAVEGNGAFICQNSWGTGFGDNGIFYISYYDSHIGSQCVAYTGVEDQDNYDNIYQTDLCGWAGQLGYNNDTAYFANVFTADSAENLEAVGFYATDKETDYEIYFVSEFEDTSSLDKRVMVASGHLDETGFYTVLLTNTQQVEKDQRYAIVVKIRTPGSVHPVAVEYAADEATKNVDLSDGEGYISMYGTEWSNVESEQFCNVCMKVYTNER